MGDENCRTAATAGLYDAELIAATKPGAVIINVGRGTVIDEPALIRGLTDGPLGSAYLDVTAVEPLPADSPLWDLPNVVISPHTITKPVFATVSQATRLCGSAVRQASRTASDTASHSLSG